MARREVDELVRQAKAMTDDELEELYYKSSLDTLGSDIDAMYELGYSEADIRERREFEEYLSLKCRILQLECERRGISLWL